MKLYIHQKSFREEHVIINPNDFPSIKIGDFLEIFHPDDKQSHLLVQVQTLSVELPQKGVVSVEQGVASLFQLRAYQTVQVRRVEPDSQDVALDLVELVFKDQYISRSDMWRLKNSLVKSCLHIQQKVEKCGIRAQVQDLWSRGGTVACGVVTRDTRLAFRSATAMVYLFIQMSSEMWDFDTCGDLYMEKAVNGFLIELFTRWKEKNSNHELSIVLFSRTYFEADSFDKFPAEMRPRLHVHENGRFYEDYYRVFAQNERRDDWLQVLAPLKATMLRYAKDIKDWQRHAGCTIKGENSNACQGNLLEALNLSLNVFDNHYMNRNFDRTGQLVNIITPGAGVFEVDRTLCKLTEQRMIDYGIGSDVVCLAEQPLHPVPLLKFLDSLNKNAPCKDKYNIPHWLNYSFYLSPSQKRRYQSTQTSFISRLRLPDRVDEDSPWAPNSYSALPKVPSSGRFHSDSSRSTLSSEGSCGDFRTNERDDDEDEDEKFDRHDSKLFQRGRRRMSKVHSLNNPFCPDTLSVILTADRRRWTHAFPHGPNGEMIQLHHRHLVKVPSDQDILDPTPTHTPSEGVSASSSGSSLNGASANPSSDIRHGRWVQVDTRRRRGCVWGITGEQAWTPFLQSGMDWKSMTFTACFPITTDFYPLNQALDSDYQERPYTICLEEEDDEPTNNSNVNKVFQELISQRLIQDFQLVVLPQQEQAGLAQRNRKDQPLVTDQSKDMCVLSYANAFHKLTLNADTNDIEVVLYTARKSSPSPKLAYTYSLWPLHKDAYEMAHTRMYHKPVENDRWNYRDSYISFGGMASREGFELQECVKFWRSRFVLLPSHSSTLRQMSERGYQGNLDVYRSEEALSKYHLLVEGFLRFFEGLNRRRTRLNVPPASGSKSQRISQGDLGQSATSPGYRKITQSGTSTPTSHHSSLTLTTGSLHSLLSGVVASRKEDPSSEPGSPKSPDKRDGKPHQASSFASVVKAMRDPSTGLGFIGGDHRGLPSDCFTTAEAVSWIRKTFIDQPNHEQAVTFLQEMLNDGYIYSVFSSRGAKQIIYGYYIYSLHDNQSESQGNSSKPVIGQPLYDIPPQQEWFQAACTVAQDKQDIPERPDGPGLCLLPVYKSIVLEMWNTDLDHMEYCQASFHSNYQPDHAFDMELQWLTSTPGLLNDLIMNWLRRAQSSGFHLIPSHVDPFCFWEDISDPLCSPVFIPLSLQDGSDMGPDLLAKLQEIILKRFGFLANHTSCLSPLPGSASKDSPYSSIHVQYVHVTGVTFALPTPTQADTTSPRPDKLPCLCSAWKESRNNNSTLERGNPHCHSTRRSRKRETPSQPGFLWVNNHLLTKKWKSSASGDDAFRESLLIDFRKLCANDEGRLDALVSMVTEEQKTGDTASARDPADL
ncbi:GATOR complex protein DEPDC5-like isoform X1 [Lytechinus variegatus]|uniref:GATOR complex protein DEPDC5-like isoform X1 n=2 Tax=Lytechinus variegatus TaxID=7654 RepID=UPI001BB23E5D|nr:GATOR complex protein DEPDC5-like isoform X1 [Lytechinus variegatus]